MNLLNTCPVCKDDTRKTLIDFGELPHSGTFLSEPQEVYLKVHLSFEFCSKCALIRRKFFEFPSGDYSKINRSTSHRLPVYTKEIIELLQSRNIKSDALIIEVGSNDGAFLDMLAKAGFTNPLGVEPSTFCAQLSLSKGHRVEEVHLSQPEAIKIEKRYGRAAVVICRHTLEHVLEPFDFLMALRSLLLDDGILVIEVPDARRIIRDMRGYELWDEHIHYFTLDNLTLLLRRTGFQVDKITFPAYRQTKNILLCCFLLSPQNKPTYPSAALAQDVQLCRDFAHSWGLLSDQLLSKVTKLKEPIASAGASHPQSNFFLFTGLGHYITFLVDDDPGKVNRFVPIPRSTRVISTEQLLKDFHRGTFIQGAFGYEDWMDRINSVLITRGINSFDPCLVFSSLP